MSGQDPPPGWERPPDEAGPPGWQAPQEPPRWDAPQEPPRWQAPQQHPEWLTGGEPAWPPPPGYQARPTSGKAIAALVLGITGILLCPLVCSVLALVFGYQARSEIDGSGGAAGGRGMAVAGIVLGWIGLVIGILLLMLIVLGLAVGESTTTNDFTRGPVI